MRRCGRSCLCLLAFLWPVSAFAGNYADIDATNTVTNLVIWNGSAPYAIVSGHQLIPYAPPAGIGSTWNGSVFSQPPVPAVIAADPTQTLATQAFVTSATASLAPISAIPTPLAAVPPGPNGAGAVGSGLSYVPGNAAQKQTVQRTTVVTDASGNWSVTWNTAFVSSSPVINPQPINATPTNPIACNTTSRSATAAAGKCWTGATNTNALLSLVISLAPTATPANTSIMVIGAEPTQ